MTISPYFYPTTIVLIDDNEKMLQSLYHALGLKKKPHKSFIYPKEGLSYINEDHYHDDFSKRLFTLDQEEEGDSLNFNPRCLLSELTRPNRFNQISVLVIDYEMPGMNGIDVCKEIENPSVKKILLTGVADEKVAIDAFNQGVIDLYVRKHDADFITKLQQAIDRLQKDYFKELFHIPLQALRNRPESTAIVDPMFETFFDKVVIDKAIQEYYLVEGMGSFILIGKNNEIHSLITVDDDIIDTYLNSQSTDVLSEKQRSSLETKSVVPCYYNPFDAPYIEPPNDLRLFLHPPTHIKGKYKTFYSVFGEGFIQIEKCDPVFWDFKVGIQK